MYLEKVRKRNKAKKDFLDLSLSVELGRLYCLSHLRNYYLYTNNLRILNLLYNRYTLLGSFSIRFNVRVAYTLVGPSFL